MAQLTAQKRFTFLSDVIGCGHYFPEVEGGRSDSGKIRSRSSVQTDLTTDIPTVWDIVATDRDVEELKS